MQTADFGKLYVQRAGTNLRLRGHELKAASQLLSKQPRGCSAVPMPPAGCLADLSLGLRDDQQPKPQSSVLELGEEIPAVDDLAAVGLDDRLPEECPLLNGKREAFLSFGDQESDHIAFLKTAFRHIQPATTHNPRGENFHPTILPPAG
jgi:hypothetical protein